MPLQVLRLDPGSWSNILVALVLMPGVMVMRTVIFSSHPPNVRMTLDSWHHGDIVTSPRAGPEEIKNINMAIILRGLGLKMRIELWDFKFDLDLK